MLLSLLFAALLSDLMKAAGLRKTLVRLLLHDGHRVFLTPQLRTGWSVNAAHPLGLKLNVKNFWALWELLHLLKEVIYGARSAPSLTWTNMDTVESLNQRRNNHRLFICEVVAAAAAPTVFLWLLIRCRILSLCRPCGRCQTLFNIKRRTLTSLSLSWVGKRCQT